MCGIFGIIINKHYKQKYIVKAVNQLFLLSESRGKEAAGIAVRNNTTIQVYKEPVKSSTFIRRSNYRKLFSNIDQKTHKNRSAIGDTNFIAVIGHSRLVTDGVEEKLWNNQPVIRDGTIGVHNGIIVNADELWSIEHEKRLYEVDSEILMYLINKYNNDNKNMVYSVQKTFRKIKGSASIALLFNDLDYILLATNTGSIYSYCNKDKKIFAFASEEYILKRFLSKFNNFSHHGLKPKKLFPGNGKLINLHSLEEFNFSINESKSQKSIKLRICSPVLNLYDISERCFDRKKKLFKETEKPDLSKHNKITKNLQKRMNEVWEKVYDENTIQRCSKCLFPVTFPFIRFDRHGVCNFCLNHESIFPIGINDLKNVLLPFRQNDDKPDCIVGLSGGRDSSYGLHIIKEVLNMNPVAFTYDWGVLTDLGRRNQARICGKLGVEHVIISADIRKKRENVRKNLYAWLKKPDLGMIPLLMAGDKPLLFYARKLMKKVGTNLIIHSTGNQLEDTYFKVGFINIKIDRPISLSRFSTAKKLNIAKYYIKQFLSNTTYLNSSIIDTMFSYFCNFFLTEESIQLYHYIPWNEDEIISTLVNNYEWELEEDTISTWRIDDGTTAFYNYIYMVVAGFNEVDTFRSAQIREGVLKRDEAFELVKKENKPRMKSLEWYSKIIGFDINDAIRRINSIPKIY